MLTKKIKKSTWEELDKDLKEITKKYKNIVAIGSGGNINKTISLLKQEDIIEKNELKTFLHKLNKMSIDQRMDTYNLKRDRADVLVPALTIYDYIMSSGKINHIIVPKIGLVDGLMYHLYQIIIKEQ
jgi:exopolyphosphatase/guanosine-5'-triphosphate,3'-diphosphate pyrophosphatase